MNKLRFLETEEVSNQSRSNIKLQMIEKEIKMMKDNKNIKI